MLKKKVFLFIYGVSSGIIINIVGRLMVAEIIALVTLPLLKVGKLLKIYKDLRLVLGLLFILLFSQILSDILNNSTPNDYLRGWALIIFSIISTIYLVNYLAENQNSIIFYFIGLFLLNSLFANNSIDTDLYLGTTNYFKIRYVPFLNPAILLFGYYLFSKNKFRLTIFIFLLFGLVCLAMDARSNGLIFIISSILIFIKLAGIKFTRRRIFFLSIIFSAILYGGYIFYVNQVIEHGFGGSNASSQLKKAENPYNPFELLYYGRTDFSVLFTAALDKPIIGHGSWGKDEKGKYARLTSEITKNKFYSSPGYIRAHSVFLGTWAYAGIIGFISISILFFTLFKRSFSFFRSGIFIKSYPIFIVLTIDMLWAFFFSPIGVLRTTFPIFAAFIITTSNRYINPTQNKD